MTDVDTSIASGIENIHLDDSTHKLSFLCSLIPKSYDGNRQELHEFLGNCDNAMRFASDTQKDALMAYIISKLTGSAKAQLRDKEFETWSQLKDLLLQLYADRKHYTQLMEELNTLKQSKDETVLRFYNKIDSLTTRLINAIHERGNPTGKVETIKELALQRFIYHSLPDISRFLRGRQIHTLSDALHLAQEEERALSLQNDLSKYSYAVAIPNHESKTIADEFVKFTTLFGIPESILTDSGTDFTSNLIKEVNKLFKIKHVLSSPYHPQTNGALERSHHTLKEYFKHYINENKNNWDEYVHLAMFTYNTHVHKSTNFTPFELIFGYKSYIPNSLLCKPEFRYSYDDYYSNLKLKMNKSFELARNNLTLAKEKSKVQYDKNIRDQNIQLDDYVYIKNKDQHKLSSKFKGPYKSKRNSINCTISFHYPFLSQHHHPYLIDPEYPYLLLSTTQTLYARIKDLNRCNKIYHDEYICYGTTTYLAKENPVCETELKLKKLEHLPEDVKPERLNPKLKSGTKSTITNAALIPSSNGTSNYSNFIPEIDLTQDMCCIEQQEYLRHADMKEIKLANMNLDDLRYAKHKLQEYETILQRNIDHPYSLDRYSRWYNVALKHPCNYQICINSHNTISHSSLDVSQEEAIRLSRLRTMDEPLRTLPSFSMYRGKRAGSSHCHSHSENRQGQVQGVDHSSSTTGELSPGHQKSVLQISFILCICACECVFLCLSI
nr:unnamed protein product [Callosobruchus analis]